MGTAIGAGGLGALNVGGTPNGTLEKLTILAHAQADYSDQPIARFAAYVNPSEITLAYEIEYDAAQGAGTTNSRMEFKKVKPGDMTLTFFIDDAGQRNQEAEIKRDTSEIGARGEAVYDP